MCYDIHNGVKQLTRIADALDRAYPKTSKIELRDFDGTPRMTITTEVEDA